MKLEKCNPQSVVVAKSVFSRAAKQENGVQYRRKKHSFSTAYVSAWLFLSACVQPPPAAAQGFGQTNLAPINLVQNVQRAGVPNPTIIPTDVTPTPIGQERELIRPGFRFYLMQKLPRKMWFNATVETSQRLETNVFFTSNNPQPDYVFRVLPNVSLGYNFRPHTSIYTNYFVIKDVFADHGILTYPTTQSLAGGLRHEIPVNNRTNVQLDCQVRELWQAAGLRQSDIIPSVTATRVFTPRCIGFANIQMQMRGAYPFNGPSREIDPFYTVGMLYRWKQWTLLATDTLVTNYRGSNAIPPQGNVAMIADFEVNRPISKKLPGVVAFVRAEPIWNWSSHAFPGLSGFDFRLFSGIRMSVSKPSYSADFNKLRQQIQGADNGSSSAGKRKKTPPSGQNQSNPPPTSNPGQIAPGSTADPNSSDAQEKKPTDSPLPTSPSGLKPDDNGSASGGSPTTSAPSGATNSSTIEAVSTSPLDSKSIAGAPL